MEDVQDAIGHLIADHLNGEAAEKIVERDDGYIGKSGGPAAYSADFEDWPIIDQRSMYYVKGRVLDIGCGAGRHALYLQGKGLDVLGIDVSPLAIHVCKKRGVTDARVMSITKVSARLGEFDSVLMMGHNFGLFGNFERAKRLLKRFHSMTSPDARIVATTLDPYDTDDPSHHEFHALNKGRGRMGGQIRLRVGYKKYRTPWFDYLFVSRDEMKDVLEGTSWEVEQFIDSDGASYAAIMRKTRS